MNYTEYEQLKQQAKDEYEKRVSAIETVWQMVQNGKKIGVETTEKCPRSGPCYRQASPLPNLVNEIRADEIGVGEIGVGEIKKDGNNAKNNGGELRIIDAVSQACIDLSPKSFTSKEVANRLTSLFPDKSFKYEAIKVSLQRLHKRQFLTRIPSASKYNLYRIS